MSFSASGSSTVKLYPSRVDIAWDGASDAKVSILPSFADTGTATTYTIGALHVFPSVVSKTVRVYANTNFTSTTTYTSFSGEPFITYYRSRAVPFVIGHTVSTSGIVSFKLEPSNTNYTATLDYVADGDYYTTKPTYYKWTIAQNRGTTSHLVAHGKVIRIPPNAYSSEGASVISSSGDLVSGITVTQQVW